MMNKFEFYLNPFLPDPGLFFSLNQVYLSLKQRGSYIENVGLYHKQASHTCLNEMSQAMLNRVVFCKDFVAKKHLTVSRYEPKTFELDCILVKLRNQTVLSGHILIQPA